MEAKDLGLGLISGRLGNMIYYVRNGKQCVRRVAIPGKKQRSETEGRTEKQRAVTGRFAIVQAFYAKYNRAVSAKIWQAAARKRRMTGSNLFNSVNCKCFSGDGRLVDFETFRFADGELLLPRRIQLVDDGRKFRVTWEEEREWTSASPTDRLWVGVLYSAHPLAPLLALDVKGTREEGTGEFTLDHSMGTVAHIYCFFGRADESAFSESRYFRLAGSGTNPGETEIAHEL